MSRIDRSLIVASLTLSLTACGIAAWSVLRADELAASASAAAPPPQQYDLAIQLSQPSDGDEVHGVQLSYSGFVDVASEGLSAREALGPGSGVALVPLVRPLVDPLTWWVQAQPMVLDGGFFQGVVSMGEENGAGVGLEFELTVVALPDDVLAPGQQLQELPSSLAASQIVTVRRAM